MKTTISDLLKRMYDIALCNDPGQEILVTVHRHLKSLGYEVEFPSQSRGDQRFAEPDTVSKQQGE